MPTLKRCPSYIGKRSYEWKTIIGMTIIKTKGITPFET
jgi:hypothetical protein